MISKKLIDGFKMNIFSESRSSIQDMLLRVTRLGLSEGALFLRIFMLYKVAQV